MNLIRYRCQMGLGKIDWSLEHKQSESAASSGS